MAGQRMLLSVTVPFLSPRVRGNQKGAFPRVRGNEKEGASPACGELDGVFGGFAVFWQGGISDASLVLSMTWNGMCFGNAIGLWLGRRLDASLRSA